MAHKPCVYVFGPGLGCATMHYECLCHGSHRGCTACLHCAEFAHFSCSSYTSEQVVGMPTEVCDAQVTDYTWALTAFSTCSLPVTPHAWTVLTPHTQVVSCRLPCSAALGWEGGNQQLQTSVRK